jgi:hypothetical protein
MRVTPRRRLMGAKIVAEAILDVGNFMYGPEDDYAECGYATVREVVLNDEYWAKYTDKDPQLFTDFSLFHDSYRCLILVFEDGSYAEEKINGY